MGWRWPGALVVLLAWTPALARGSIFNELAGVHLCVDDASLDVRFERGGEVAIGLVRERLWRSLERTFTGASLLWRRADGSVRASPADTFDVRVVELFDERAVGTPAVVFLPRYVEAGLRDLSVRWWQDPLAAEADSEAGRSRPWLGVGVAVGVTAGVGAILAAAMAQFRRRSRR